MGHRIRPAVVDDVEALRVVSERAWHAGHGAFVDEDAIEEFLDAYYGAESFREAIGNEDAILYVDETEANGVVGFTHAKPTGDPDDTFALVRIYVHPEWWSRGVGTRLLSETESTIRERGGRRVRLGVIAENERAVGFYESRGYERVADGYDERLDVRNYTYAKSLDR